MSIHDFSRSRQWSSSIVCIKLKVVTIWSWCCSMLDIRQVHDDLMTPWWRHRDQSTSIMKLIIHLTINHDFDDILLDGLHDDKMMSSRLLAASNMIKFMPYSWLIHDFFDRNNTPYKDDACGLKHAWHARMDGANAEDGRHCSPMDSCRHAYWRCWNALQHYGLCNSGFPSVSCKSSPCLLAQLCRSNVQHSICLLPGIGVIFAGEFALTPYISMLVRAARKV